MGSFLVALFYFSLTNKNRGVVECFLPGPHFRSEAGCGAKKTVAGSILSRLSLPLYRLGPRGSEMGPRLLSVWVWAAETCTQERKISSVLHFACTADITNRSPHSLPRATLRILLNTGTCNHHQGIGVVAPPVLGGAFPRREHRACWWPQEARADTWWKKEA